MDILHDEILNPIVKRSGVNYAKGLEGIEASADLMGTPTIYGVILDLLELYPDATVPYQWPYNYWAYKNMHDLSNAGVIELPWFCRVAGFHWMAAFRLTKAVYGSPTQFHMLIVVIDPNYGGPITPYLFEKPIELANSRMIEDKSEWNWHTNKHINCGYK